MRDVKIEASGERAPFAPFKEMWGDKKLRPLLVRYILPVVFALLLLVTALLPIISFRTTAGESDMGSLLYWHTANFFGTDDARGAYELLKLYDEGNAYYGFYRALVVVCIVDSVAAVLGVLLTVAHSLTAVYLLATEEKSERSRFVGKLFRVAWGNRWTAIIPYVLSVVPFAFSKLFAYISSTLRSFDTSAEFLLIDPLWVALAFLAIEVVLLLRTRDGERRSRWNIYVPPELRTKEKRDKTDAETREWEAAVQRDAAEIGHSDTPTEEDRTEKPQAADEALSEMRDSIRALFDDSDPNEK